MKDHDIKLWSEYEKSWKQTKDKAHRIHFDSIDLIETVRSGLQTNPGPALDLLAMFGSDELIPYADILLDGASHQNPWSPFYNRLFDRLPKRWIIENIEVHVDNLLSDIGDDEQYSTLIVIFDKIDAGLAKMVALKAASHSDEEIREIGTDYLEK